MKPCQYVYLATQMRKGMVNGFIAVQFITVVRGESLGTRLAEDSAENTDVMLKIETSCS